MQVVIVGAGLAGLSLATGLAAQGHQVEVLEADASISSRDPGYRLHLDGRGLTALRELLPPPAYAVVEATGGRFTDPRQLTVLSGRLHHLKTVTVGAGVIDGRLVSTAVDRGTLRTILASAAQGAGARLHWSSALRSVEVPGDGTQTLVVRTVDGAERVAQLVVGCDGPHSALAGRVAPDAEVIDAGGGAIVGRSPVAAVSDRLRQELDHGFVVLRGLRSGLGLGLMRFMSPPHQAGATAGIALPAVDDYVGWSVGLTDRAPMQGAEPERLQREAMRRVRTWHRDLRRIVAAADPRRIFLAPTLQARRPVSWSTTRLTIIGDAAHAMPPDRGSGANLALADAARLVAALASIDTRDEPQLLAAIGAAEREMVDLAFAVSEAGPTAERSAT